MRRVILLSILLLAWPLLASCATYRVLRTDDLDFSEPHKTLLASYRVVIHGGEDSYGDDDDDDDDDDDMETDDEFEFGDREEEGGLLMTPGMLEEFGESALQRVQGAMLELGFATFLDEDTAELLDDLDFVDSDSSLPIFTGVWVHDDTNRYSWDELDMQTRGKRRDAAEKLADGDDDVLYASVTMRIMEDESWVLLRAPKIRLSLSVIDKTGAEMLRSTTTGSGSNMVFLANRSNANLLEALDEAIRQVADSDVGRL